MKKIILAAALVAPTVAQAQAVPPAIIAIVDAQRILRDCTACRAANTQLLSQQTALQQRAQQLQSQLDPERTAIEAAGKAASGKVTPALQTRIDAFEKRGQAAQTELANRQQTLQSTAANVQNQIGARLGPIVTQVMTQRGANVVLEKNSTMSNAATLEITDAVLAELNRQLPSVSVTPAPAAASPQGR